MSLKEVHYRKEAPFLPCLKSFLNSFLMPPPRTRTFRVDAGALVSASLVLLLAMEVCGTREPPFCILQDRAAGYNAVVTTAAPPLFTKQYFTCVRSNGIEVSFVQSSIWPASSSAIPMMQARGHKRGAASAAAVWGGRPPNLILATPTSVHVSISLGCNIDKIKARLPYRLVGFALVGTPPWGRSGHITLPGHYTTKKGRLKITWTPEALCRPAERRHRVAGACAGSLVLAVT